MFTKQETFDLVANHLLKQGERSCNTKKGPYGVGHDCLYKAGKLMCAAGCLIPKGRYKKELEGLTVAEICDKFNMSSFFGHDIDLCLCLQLVHDQSPISQWKKKLIAVAERHELEAGNCLVG